MAHSESRANTIPNTPAVGANLDLTELPLSLSAGDRYHERDLLGRGGMGEVRLCLDRTIGREVALKVIRQPTGGIDRDLVQRFLREARVQGQLEHPSIVPVHELGTARDGALYFTMKRVRGSTLAEVIEVMRAGLPMAAAFTRRRLLSAFSTVCLAVDFAHSRGVLHRDLKPGNLMLGDFGEVYVLDWGLAKVRGAEDVPATDGDGDGDGDDGTAGRLDSALLGGAKTAHGDVMGTPGYMAPEQLRG